MSSRKLDVVQKTAKEISSETGNQVLAIQCDVRDPEGVKAAADTCVSELGLPHMIINNAAGNFIAPTERLSSNAFRTILEIVLHGTAFVTLEFGKRLIKSNQGCSFLSISTTYTKHGSGFVVPSAAAKAGVEAITKSLAVEWGRYGMRFNAIAPGPIETKGAFSRLDPTGEFRKHMLQRIPTGRLGEVEELANLAMYVLSDYANWMTGEVITLDGGELPRMAGELNDLLAIPTENWDELESIIKATKGS